ncbi:murein biosynthesis integral membrane protein MurJ [Gordonia sp. NPDC127522]|uniref:murein biosynthesis integral membrane protein MurJ n=1 Tax=Gordonia sp. NPDC127522 TaxID=3345390 RepID=UPI0036448ADE
MSSQAFSAGRVAVATAASRVTGFVRTVVLAGILGASAVADAYNGANTFPNMVYAVLLGGVLSSVVVPVLARSRLRGRVDDEAFVQRLLVVSVLGMLTITACVVAAAPWIAGAFVAERPQRDLATAWSYMFLPQVLFYGVAAMATAILQVRNRFGAPAWAPVVNNVIVIATVVVFVAVPGPAVLTPSTINSAQLAVLGAGTTLGIIGQSLWCVVLLRRSGFRWRWRVRLLPYTWRPLVVGSSMAGWVFVYVAASQVGVAVVTRAAFDHQSVSAYTYADLLLQMPYGILAVSILTVLTPRIANAVAADHTATLRAQLRTGARYLLALSIPVAGALAVFAPTAATLVFVGNIDSEQARQIGQAVAASAFGLPFLALVMLQLRVFYGQGDTRTPALINVAMVSVKVSAITVGIHALNGIPVVVVLCASGALSYLVGAVAGHLILRHRFGLLGFRRVAETSARAGLLTLCAAVSALGTMWAADQSSPTTDTVITNILTLGAGTLLSTCVFAYLLRIVRIPEVTHAGRLAMRLASR